MLHGHFYVDMVTLFFFLHVLYIVISLKLIWKQVICWVLGEYGTADGKYSASYISGKLCDVAEAHSTDDIVKVCWLALLTNTDGLFFLL